MEIPLNGAWERMKASKSLDLKVRGLYVDGRMKESMLGASHDVTARTFVVCRTFRENDNLPTETVSPRWIWQRGGWRTVDRVSGHISSIAMPEFDHLLLGVQLVSGLSPTAGSRTTAKAVRHRILDGTSQKNFSASRMKMTCRIRKCPPPTWERRPARVIFEADQDHKASYVVRGTLGGPCE
jgi:hypothetical protein